MKRMLSLMLTLLFIFPAVCLAETIGGREYVNLPALMVMEDGTPVTTTEQMAARRAELLKLFADTMYGHIPTEGFTTTFEVLEEGEMLDGAAIRKQIKITVTTDKGSCDALMLLVLPKSDAPVPVIYGLGFGGVHTTTADPAVLASYSIRKWPKIDETTRGTGASRWPIETAVQRGYGVAVACCEDFSPDNIRTFGKRVISLFDDPSFKGISAWAFGLQRMTDYLVTDPMVDANRLAVTGTSRLGKAALWAGANDERIALVIPTVSGTCGAAMSRSNRKETFYDLNATFRWWMSNECKAYAECVDELPVDQHELIACVAPRRVYLSSAETDTSNDSQGTWIALLLSRDAFRLYNIEVIEGDIGEQPGVGERVFTEAMAYHMRTGTHGVNEEDWNNYMDYMDQYMK